MRDIARPLASPLFRRLWLGQTVSYSGDAAYAVALALYLLPRPDAPHAIGLTLGATAFGGVMTLLLGGALADRYRRSRVIVASDLMRAAAVAGLVIGGPHAPLWFLGALAVVQGVGSGLHRPAYGAVLRSTVPRDVLSHANALRTVSTRLAAVLGAALGGVLADATTPRWVLAGDVATFGVSMVTLLGFGDGPPQGASEKKDSLWADITDGLAYVLRRPWMVAVMAQGTAQLALVAAPVALLLPLLTGGGHLYGWIVAAEAAGAFGGASLGAALRTRSPGWLAMAALLAQLPQTVTLALDAPAWSVLLCSALTGAGLSVFAVVWTTALQTGVEHSRLGRVFAVDAVAATVLSPFGYVISGWLLAAMGKPTYLAWFAAGALSLSVLVVLPVPGLRHLANQDEEMARG